MFTSWFLVAFSKMILKAAKKLGRKNTIFCGRVLGQKLLTALFLFLMCQVTKVL
jgi:hypothetical protein